LDTQPPDSISSLFQDPARRARPTRWLEWCLLSVLLLSAVAALSGLRSLERIDLVINDQLGRLNSPQLSSDIVIVAIDDKSLEAIGRWPWRRAIHAAVLDRIAAAKPRAVGLDLIFVESDPVEAGDDRLLGDAIARAGRVVLPLVLRDIHGDGRLSRSEPVPALAAPATALGHVHLEIDNDGIVRSTFLREGDGTRWWDHFALAVLRVGGFAPPKALPGQRAPPPSESLAWQRDHWIQIPFSGPPGSFERVSYVDVLKGQVSAERLAGKYVLVGATAAGMGDAYATPRSGRAELMPGVEIAANVMNALLLDQRLQRAMPWQSAVFCVLPVALALLTVVLLPPTAGLLASAALLTATLGAAWLGASLAGLQFAPAAGLLGVLLAYPLWVWRRLRTAIGYLLEEFQRMEARRDLPTMLPASRSGDLLDRHIHALQDASEQLRNLHRFVSETLNSVPDATLITDTSGQVLMANQSARQYFAARQITRLRGRPLEELLRHVRRTDTRQPIFDARDRLRQDNVSWGAEARDADGHDLLVRFVPCFNTEGYTTSWITSLVDITPIREAERQRDVALRFISHDMRSPQSSILALLEVQRMNPQAPVPADMLERIERHAHRTLDLAEEFVQLARAESSTYRMQTVDLVDLLDEAVDDVWPQAQTRGVAFDVQRPDAPALCQADKGLLTRAIANLLVNAVKYGQPDASVHCAVRRTEAGWHLSITNEGAGLQPEQLQSLFQQFARLDPDQSATRGVGLGLVFVRTVVERHGGRIEVNSRPGQGTTFHFTLPPTTA
jgi:CHASE2 domain-containing sensor protein/signal transduction histidine kinase